jgi:hypothetical protein
VQAFEYFLNLNTRSPEYISLFIDDKLRKGLKVPPGRLAAAPPAGLATAAALLPASLLPGCFDAVADARLPLLLLLSAAVGQR